MIIIRTFKDLDQVKQDLRECMPLVELVEATSGVIPIKVSENLYKLNCIFHNESTPSFMITPSKGLYHCFGCKKGGDEIAYLERLYNLSFIEAIYKYAELSKLDLTPYYKELTPEEYERERLIGVLDSFVMTCEFSLRNTTGKAHDAYLYLLLRGFSEETIKQFRIGYSETPVNNIDQTMRLLELDRPDVLFDSLIFPDCDPYGRPVRIYGRPFTKKNEKDPKYIGTSKRSPIYEYTLYGFHIARKNIRKHNNKLIAVEGQADTAKMHQHGFDNTVGLKGTAFTEETIELLNRFKVDEVILLMDGDDAGRTATRSIVSKYYSTTNKSSVRLRVANIYGYDPDEFLNAFGRDKMAEIINKSVYAIEFIIDDVFHNWAYDTMTERVELLRELQPYVNNADQIEKKLAIHNIADKLQMDTVFVEDFFKTNNTVIKYQLYSVEGERVILSECMRNANFIISVADRLTADDFYLSKHKALYQLLLEMANNKELDINIDTIIGYANNKGKQAYFENGEYIRELEHIGNSAIEFHINDIHDKSMRRKVDSFTDGLKGSLNDLNVDTSQAIEIFNNKVTDAVVSKSNTKILDSSRQVDLTMAKIMDRTQNSDKMLGYHIGDRLGALSHQLRGVQRQRLHTVSASQGVGKSKLLSSMMMGISVEGIERVPTLMFSYEMPIEECTMRNLAILSGISQDKMLDGTMTFDEHDILQQWAIRLRESPFFLSSECRVVQEALALARKHILYHGVKVIAFDYIQLMRMADARGISKNLEMGMITKLLKEFGMQMDVAVIIVAQLGKQVVGKELATAEDVYFGYEIAQDSDVFITLQEKSQEQVDQMGLEKGNLLVHLAKNRGSKDGQIYNAYAHHNNARIHIV